MYTLMTHERRENHNKAAIMVTHDERMLQYCDRVYQMNDDQLEETLQN